MDVIDLIFQGYKNTNNKVFKQQLIQKITELIENSNEIGIEKLKELLQEAYDKTKDNVFKEMLDELKSSNVESFKVGFVTSTAGIDDELYNQRTWEGIKRYADENQWIQGREYKYIQSNEDSEYILNLSTFGNEKCNVIIAAGFDFYQAMRDVAPRYPESNFTIIDMWTNEQPNVASVVFAEEQGSFLVGVAAAKSTKTKKVGFVGGIDFPVTRMCHAGFVAGVKAVDPSIEIVDEYAGNFGDSNLGQQIASNMYDQGVDIIYHVAGETGYGIIKEAKDRVQKDKNVWVIGVDYDQYEDGKLGNGKSVVLTSMINRVDVAAYKIIDLAKNGEFPGGQILTMTLADDGVGIPNKNPNLSDEIIKDINYYKAKIINGNIRVPTTFN